MKKGVNGYLVFTAALCGALVMVVEFAGVRMLSVGYGATLAVWAIMISVTMLSLAVGYFVGGTLADRHPRPLLLFTIVIASGLLTVLCPFTRAIMRFCYDALGYRWGVLASSLAVFFVPLGLLGTVSPFVIRLLSERHEGVGFTSGGVYAVSTVGSVVGALAAGLWLLPSLGVAMCFRVAGAAALIGGGLGVALSAGRRPVSLLVLLPAVALVLPAPETKVGLSYRAPDGDAVEVLDSVDSPHGRILVLSKGNYRLLVVNGIVQTGIPDDLDTMRRGDALANRYFQELLPYMVEDPVGTRALVIGLAGGMTARVLDKHGVRVDAVDIDPGVIAVARKWFGYTDAVTVADGRQFLEDCESLYDFCILDTYSGDAMPFYLASREAFESAAAVLQPNGIVAINYIGSPQGEAFACIYRTLAAVFPHVSAIRGEDGDRVQTITVFASRRAMELTRGWLIDRPSFSGVDPVSEDIDRLTITPDLSRAFVLTDDRNPIDSLRAGEALAWRRRTMDHLGEDVVF